MPEIDVLIPYYRDTDRRQRIWDFNRAGWERIPGAVIRTGGDAGVYEGRPFSPGRARNAAARSGRAEWVLAYDSDVVPPTEDVLADTLERALELGWAWPFTGTKVVKVKATDWYIDGIAELDDVKLITRIPSALGPTLMRRELFEAAHGYDERFEGWGYEDTALRRLLHVLAGHPAPPPHKQDCWALSPYLPDLVARHLGSQSNRDRYEREYSGLDRDGLENLFALRRAAAVDHSPAHV